jgi:hypothetical protein
MKFSEATRATRFVIKPDEASIILFRGNFGQRLPTPCLVQFGPQGGDNRQSEMTLRSVFRMRVGRVIGRKRLKVTTRAPILGKGSSPTKVGT